MSDPIHQLPTGEIRVAAPRMTGQVLWFSGEKGYGFIQPDEGDDHVFVRHSAIVDARGFRSLEEGQRVSFEPGDDGRGPRALQVRRENGAGPA